MNRGFTLIETLVAIVLAAGVLLTAHAVLAGVGDGADRIIAGAAKADAGRASTQRVRQLLAFTRTLEPDSVTFLGSPRAMFARGYCPVPGGWSQRCSIALNVDDSLPRLLVTVDYAAPTAVGFVASAQARLCYLASARDGGRWLTDWPSTGELPVALGIVLDGDTTIVPVGR